jgi:hypothetical protein
LEMDINFGLDIYLGMSIDLDGHIFEIEQWLGNGHWFIILYSLVLSTSTQANNNSARFG